MEKARVAAGEETSKVCVMCGRVSVGVGVLCLQSCVLMHVPFSSSPLLPFVSPRLPSPPSVPPRPLSVLDAFTLKPRSVFLVTTEGELIEWSQRNRWTYLGKWFNLLIIYIL